MAKKKPSRGKIWMLVPTEADLELLRKRVSAKGPLWDQWEFKLHRHRIIIYDPVIPMNRETGLMDPALRYMQPHLRISPDPQTSFRLEFRRHTEQWCPLHISGSIDEIADAILKDPFGVCRPIGQFDAERLPGELQKVNPTNRPPSDTTADSK